MERSEKMEGLEGPNFFSAEDFKDMFATNNLEQMEPFLFTTNWLSSEDHMKVDRYFNRTKRNLVYNYAYEVVHNFICVIVYKNLT
jgi:hypothetical protein